MPDISLCRNATCVLKYKCYRYMAKPSERQSYSTFFPKVDGSCDWFYDIRGIDDYKLDKYGDKET